NEKVAPERGTAHVIGRMCSDSERVAQWVEVGGPRPVLAPRVGGVGESDKYLALLLRFQTLMRELPLFVFELDPHDKIVSYSSGHLDDLDIPRSQFMGKKLAEVFPAPAAKAF